MASCKLVQVVMERRLATILLTATLVATGAGTSAFASGKLEEGRLPSAGGGSNMRDSGGGDNLSVKWTGARYVLGKNSQLSEGEAGRLLQEPLDITENKIRFGGSVCEGVVFSEETVEAAGYLWSAWGMTPAALGVSDEKLEVIRTNCEVFGFKEYVRLSRGRLAFLHRGVFFFFDPFVLY